RLGRRRLFCWTCRDRHRGARCVGTTRSCRCRAGAHRVVGNRVAVSPAIGARRCAFRVSGPPERTCGGRHLPGVVDPTSPGFRTEKTCPLQEKTMNTLTLLFPILFALFLTLAAADSAVAADLTTQPAKTVHVKITVK